MTRAATPKEQKFAELYLTGKLTATDCYRIAYDSRATAKSQHEAACKVLKRESVRSIVEQGRAKVIEQIALAQSDLVRLWSEAITTDRNEIVELRRVACRYCYGVDHRYQETPAERERRYGEHQMLLARTPEAKWKEIPAFDERGGLGYDRRKGPHEDCPECHGFGEELLLPKDTRTLSPAARALYDGVDVKNGAVVVKVRDRESAEDRLAKHRGMFIDRKVHMNPDGTAIDMKPVSVNFIAVKANG